MKIQLNSIMHQRSFIAEENHSSEAKPVSHLKESYKSLKSCSPMTQQIPTVSPSCPKINNFDEESNFKVQMNGSNSLSELISKYQQSPQRKQTFLSYTVVKDYKAGYSKGEDVMSPIKSALILDSSRSRQREPDQNSPAVSLSNHMDEIYRRCTTLKTNQFVNHYLHIGLSDTNKTPELNHSNEIKFFSPDPEPIKFCINMADQIQKQEMSDQSSLGQFVQPVTFQNSHRIEKSSCKNEKNNSQLRILSQQQVKEQIQMFDKDQFPSTTSMVHSAKSKQY